ncbi:MAG: hypothetical protein C5B49_05105 [Bdellovibrio sp.]|nr:MAG: hypothetical protein C5B49_05105 [Bdellovibrio sp.]
MSRLKAGNPAEKQRYEKILSAIHRVMADPIHPQFRKDLPQNYKAADVLGQYRLFFRIVPAAQATDVKADVVHFVWVNDEESIHRSGEPGDCYQVFLDKVLRGEIDEYTPDPLPQNERFRLHDDWGSSFVYVSFRRTIDGEEQHADSHLKLNQIASGSYLIDYVTVSKENIGLASSLLARLGESVDSHGIKLTYELESNDRNFGKVRHLLEKFHFELDDIIESVEIWIRRADRKRIG